MRLQTTFRGALTYSLLFWYVLGVILGAGAYAAIPAMFAIVLITEAFEEITENVI